MDAMLNSPVSVVQGRNGNLLISDTGNYIVRMVDMISQNISTVAGRVGIKGYIGYNVPATSASLGSFTNVAVDFQGKLLITDSDSHRIRETILESISKSHPSGQPSQQPSSKFEFSELIFLMI
jgi:hypothetical protein